MARPSFKEQEGIERRIIFDVFEAEEAPHTWKLLWSRAEEAGVSSKSTLSDYLKRLEAKEYVTRVVDPRKRPPAPIYTLLKGSRERWKGQNPRHAPISISSGEVPRNQLRRTEVDQLLVFTYLFAPPDADRILDRGTLYVLAERTTHDPTTFVYLDPKTKRLWEKVAPNAPEVGLFFSILYRTLLSGFAKRRMLAMGDGPRPHISESSASDQVAWLKKAFDFDVTLTFRLKGRDAFDWSRLQSVLEELKSSDKWRHVRRRLGD